MRMKVHRPCDAVAMTLTAETETYDGMPPITQIRFDYRPHALARGHPAISAALLFDRYTNGAFNPAGHVSPLTAEALRRWFAPRVVTIGGVDAAPHAVSEIGRRMLVDDGTYRAAAMLRLFRRPGDVIFRLAPLTAVGTALDADSATVRTNAAALLGLRSTVSGALIRVGAAFALLQDYGVNELFIPETASSTLHCRDGLSVVGEATESKVSKLQRLLASVNVRLEAPFAGLSENAVAMIADAGSMASAPQPVSDPDAFGFERAYHARFLATHATAADSLFMTPESDWGGLLSRRYHATVRGAAAAVGATTEADLGARFVMARDRAYTPYAFARYAETAAA